MAPIPLAISAVESVLKLSTTMISTGLRSCETMDNKQSAIVASAFLEGITTETAGAL